MVKTSLDRFINKGHKKYFLYYKTVQARLKYPVQLSNGSCHLVFTIRKPDTNCVRKVKHSKAGNPAFGCIL
jgi:hypothetical protein